MALVVVVVGGQRRAELLFYPGRFVCFVGTMRFLMEDGRLEAVFEGGRCGRVSTRPTRTVIR